MQKCPRKKVFFDPNNEPKIAPNSRGKIRTPNTKNLNYFLRCPDQTFISFVQRCFTWEAEERLTPSEALIVDWILEGLPDDIRAQHLIQMQKTAPHLEVEQKFAKYGIYDKSSDESVIKKEIAAQQKPIQKITKEHPVSAATRRVSSAAQAARRSPRLALLSRITSR